MDTPCQQQTDQLPTAGKKTDQEKLTCLKYSEKEAKIFQIQTLAELDGLEDIVGITWLHCQLPNPQTVADIGKRFGVHSLVQEDILHPRQRPKIEEYEDYIFLLFKRLSLLSENSIRYEQISLLVFKKMVISFHDSSDPDPQIERLVKRLLDCKSRLRSQGTDFLAHAILDGEVDQYYVVTEKLEERLEEAEGNLFNEVDTKTFTLMQLLKREIIYIRRSISPLREILIHIEREESPFFSRSVLPFFRDVLDHVTWAVEALDSYRDLINGMLDISLTQVSNRTNDIMKVLTIFTTIFTPLTFLVGVYGMNFDYMPELHWKWAYPALWVFFLLITAGLFAFFKRRNWL